MFRPDSEAEHGLSSQASVPTAKTANLVDSVFHLIYFQFCYKTKAAPHLFIYSSFLRRPSIRLISLFFLINSQIALLLCFWLFNSSTAALFVLCSILYVVDSYH